LFAAAPDHGAPLLAATFPRAYCDANREPWELDPAMFADALPPWVNTTSSRVTAGLGTIARVVASGEAIYRGKLTFAEAERRVETCWKPFHDALVSLIETTRAQFGQCVLIDCHSMPSHVPVSGRGDRLADIVLGDAHGTTCAAYLTRFVERRLIELGYRVRRNDPYAGGFISRHYGKPRDGVHALQIEIARDLYMDETRYERSTGFPAVQRDLSLLIESLAAEVARSGRF
jgi:N-formylglutamate amidohydrolase